MSSNVILSPEHLAKSIDLVALELRKKRENLLDADLAVLDAKRKVELFRTRTLLEYADDPARMGKNEGMREAFLQNAGGELYTALYMAEREQAQRRAYFESQQLLLDSLRYQLRCLEIISRTQNGGGHE